MNKVQKNKIIKLKTDNPLAKGLLKMLEHKKLRERFWAGDITFVELNEQLREHGIKKQYEHPSAV